MKKSFILTSVAATLFLAQANAQISIAPEAGLNLASATAKTDYPPFGTIDFDTKMKTGFRAGTFVRIPVIAGFYVEPGLFYSLKGTKISYDMNFFGQSIELKGSSSLSYLELPLNLGYEFDLDAAGGVFVTAGPYLGYALSGKTKTESIVNGVSEDKVEEDIRFGSDDGEMKRMDFGLNFSAGYRSPFGVYFRAQYGLGLANLTNSSGSTYKNKTISFSIGYAFDL